MFESIIGFLVWAVANAAYISYRRSGEGGIGRIAAFFFGFPMTLVWMVMVSEGLGVEWDENGDRRLWNEVERDRRLREAGAGGTAEAVGAETRELQIPRETDGTRSSGDPENGGRG